MDRSPLNIGHPEKVTKLGKLPTCSNRTELGVAQNMDLCSQISTGGPIRSNSTRQTRGPISRIYRLRP